MERHEVGKISGPRLLSGHVMVAKILHGIGVPLEGNLSSQELCE
jgi:hypothetical protein